jgi:hypothetical protein
MNSRGFDHARRCFFEQVATVGALPTVAFCRVQQPTVNSNYKLTVATSYRL